MEEGKLLFILFIQLFVLLLRRNYSRQAPEAIQAGGLRFYNLQ
jgi:hypothetical protein